MAEPAAYPWPVDRVDRLDTHISHLFFVGDRVVKIKRPVDYGFVDLTELASRKRACEDEVRLNRRLTDDIYIAAEPIVRTSSGVSIGTRLPRRKASRNASREMHPMPSPTSTERLIASVCSSSSLISSLSW